MKTIIKNTLLLYSFVLIIPLVMTVMYIMTFILGIETKVSYFEFLRNFFYSGTVLEIASYKIHISILFDLFLINLISTLTEDYV